MRHIEVLFGYHQTSRQIHFTISYSYKLVRFYVFCLFTTTFIIWQTPVAAQTDHYWSQNFNTPSSLLGGAVVGGSAGPSALFYNPSLIDNDTLPSLSLSASLISLQFFNAENVVGQGLDLFKFQFKVQPKFISYVVENNNPRLGFEIGFLAPVSEELSFRINHDKTLDIIDRIDGDEFYNGFLEYRYIYKDTWIGFGTSYQLFDRFLIGGSTFLSVKTLDYFYSRRSTAFQDQDPIFSGGVPEPFYSAQAAYSELLDYWHLSFIFKFGAQITSRNGRLSGGVTLTLPNIDIDGQAIIRKEFNKSRIFDNSTQTFTADQTSVDYQEKLPTTVKTPFSISLGIQFATANFKNDLFLTVEYFAPVQLYEVVNAKSPIRRIPELSSLTPSFESYNSFFYSAENVTNVALGFKQVISSKLLFLGGFRTDFNNSSSKEFGTVAKLPKVNQLHFNRYHLTGGPVVQLSRYTFVTGIQYTFGGTKDLDQLVNFAEPLEYIPATGQSLEGVRESNMNVKLNDLTLFLGVIVDLGGSKNQNK